MTQPKPVINNIEVYNCEDGNCYYYIYYDHLPDVEVDVWLDGSPVEAGDAEAGRIDVGSLQGILVSVQIAFRVGSDYTLSDTVQFTPQQSAARAPDALLHLVTVPTGAMAVVGGQELIGSTDQIYWHLFSAGVYTERVSVTISLKHFKDKTFKRTLRPGLNEYASYNIVTAEKIKGTTTRYTHSVHFIFQLFNKKTGNRIVEIGTKMTLLNQLNGQTIQLVTDETEDPGAANITLMYSDPFFAVGKQKIVCILDNSADRIRSFRFITISEATGDSVGIDEEWHDEDDDTSNTTDSIDAAYARIGQ